MDMNRLKRSGIFIIAGCAVFGVLLNADAKTGIINTKHNLSVSGPGEIKALSETRICIFCHTPHNAAPLTPLWNKKLEPITYTLYSSSTMGAIPRQPTGPTRLCLSCHDGTLALGAVLSPLDPQTGLPLNILMTREITADRRSYIGTSLADDHPVSFSYYDALPNPELSPTLPPDLLFYGVGEIHCSTCHDAHENDNKKFLAVDNVNSALCLKCHIKDGWMTTTHNIPVLTSGTWNGAPPNPWPRTGLNTDFNWTTVQQNGCENCHTPHTAGGSKRLLNYLEEENNCYPCHNGNVASKNIQAQFTQKLSHHQVEAAAGAHDPKESPALIRGHVECVDCHNPHVVTGNPAAPPYVSGRLQKVSGVMSDGVTPVFPAQYEYEICLKCHAGSAPQIPFIPRVVIDTNKSVQFNTSNPSYHPVMGAGRNLFIPSIPGSDPDAPPNLTASSIIYCTDCHSDEGIANGGSGSRGPHGSQYAPILKREYETTLGTPESYQTYNLCYRCHSQTSILSDVSFQKSLSGMTPSKGGHSGHLGPTVGAPCSVCHDPHGVRDDGGLTGDHQHLINFDTRYVTGPTGVASPPPLYKVNGAFSGNCTLICHGFTHNNTSYP
jgi:predicted CXXCH cytochrome family protein